MAGRKIELPSVAVPSPVQPGSGSEGWWPIDHTLSAPRTPGNCRQKGSTWRRAEPAERGRWYTSLRQLLFQVFDTEYQVNVLDGLNRIRERLIDNDADSATLQSIDLIIKRAALPAAAPASANSLLQLVRMLMRTPAANSNVRVYNDFARLEEELDAAGVALRERQAEEDARPIPKTKKYYKQVKARQQKTGGA